MIELSGIEYPIVGHCNLQCELCSHGSWLSKPRFSNVDTICRDILFFCKLFTVNKLTIIGGEPTLHPDLLDILKNLYGITKNLVLYTNGTLLDKLPDELWNYLNSLTVSFYNDIKLSMSNEEIKLKCIRHNIKYNELHIISHRKAIVTKKNNYEFTKRIYNSCKKPFWEVKTLCDGKFYKCPIIPNMPYWTETLGIKDNFENDSISLHNNNNFLEDYEKYMKNTEPLNACSYCLSNLGKEFPIRQATQFPNRNENGEDFLK